MKKYIAGLLGVCLLFSMGCASGPSGSKVAGAFSTIGQAAQFGLLTYDQIQEMKATATAEEGSVIAPVDPVQPGAPVKPLPQPVIVDSAGSLTVILGNTRTCGLTRSFLATHPKEKIEAALPWVNVVYLDYEADRKEFNKYRPRGGFSFPLVRFFQDGIFKGEVLARHVSMEALIKQTGDLLPYPKE